MKRLLLFFTALLCCAQAFAAAPQLDYGAFRLLPILHEGRIKPLDSYARIKLREFSGAETTDGIAPPAWLAETLFDPATAMTRPIFRITDNNLKAELSLDQSRETFALTELEPALHKRIAADPALIKKTDDDLTPQQKSLLQLYGNVLDDQSLLRAFTLSLPLNVALPASYAKQFGVDPAAPASYQALLKTGPAIVVALRAIIKTKGENIEKYSPDEKQLAALAFSLQQIRDGAGDGGADFKILPARWPSASAGWVTPWDLAINGNGGPQTAQYMQYWQTLAAAYRTGDAARWSATATNAFQYVAVNQSAAFSVNKFLLEIIYNETKPFNVALCFYCLALGLALALIFRKKPGPAIRALPAFLCCGLLTHLFGITARVIVLSRPPVGTLYEAVLFVSLICAAASSILYIKNKTPERLFPGLAAAATLLLIAPAVLQKGESMEMLVAVLNTNFWLATHVLCITTGYAASITTAGLAHAWLITKFFNPRSKHLGPLQQSLYIASLAALFFTATGTALGGIWADQSWGRFWGWDPKENGALLIALWLIWIQHGRVAKQLSPLAFAIAAAFLNVIVALSWFGVNLLSVGLHSYGFTSGIAAGLAAFCGAEIILLTTFLFLIKRSQHAH